MIFQGCVAYEHNSLRYIFIQLLSPFKVCLLQLLVVWTVLHIGEGIDSYLFYVLSFVTCVYSPCVVYEWVYVKAQVKSEDSLKHSIFFFSHVDLLTQIKSTMWRQTLLSIDPFWWLHAVYLIFYLWIFICGNFSTLL